MKIDITHDLLKAVDAGNVHRANTSNGGQFGRILRETMGRENSSQTASAQQPGLTAPVCGVRLDPFSLPLHPSPVEQAEQLLDALDAYRHKLGDPDAALAEVNPLLQEIQRESDRLKSTMDALPDVDPLKEILNQTLVVSSLEALKFNRGDYGAL